MQQASLFLVAPVNIKYHGKGGGTNSYVFSVKKCAILEKILYTKNILENYAGRKKMKLTIGKAAKELGVTIETLRRWEKEGKITAERTRGGHRRFDIQSLRGLERKPKTFTHRTN